MINTLRAVLTEAFTPTQLDITDDSAKHNGHGGIHNRTNSHFSITLVSPLFIGKTPLQRHRAVNAILDPFFKAGVHAVQLNLSAPQSIPE
ncbi:MAG: BolA family protein [Candidatus Margulisiibacteriota bacterium]